jgi:hypothetical protein
MPEGRAEGWHRYLRELPLRGPVDFIATLWTMFTTIGRLLTEIMRCVECPKLRAIYDINTVFPGTLVNRNISDQ